MGRIADRNDVVTPLADFDAIRVGDRQELVRHITEADVRAFVAMTGDDNPLHVDRAYAASTSFKDIVVHGMLGASFVSTVIGTKLPGPGALWVSQNFEFLLPVRMGDELTVSCTVLKKHDRDRLLELDALIVNQHGQRVLTGTGKVKLLTVASAVTAPSRLRSRVAIVTGGAGGIGSAISRSLAGAGFSVVVNYHRNERDAVALVRGIEEDGGSAIPVGADISTEDGAHDVHEAATRAFGDVGVLVNNASPRLSGRTFAELSWADVEQQLDVQVKGAFLMAKACVPAMTQQRFGRIVNITSQAIEGTPTNGWMAYAVAKSGVSMLSRYLASELGPTGITVNCVAPGLTDTALIGDIPEKSQLLIARQTPMRRLANPTDVAGAVAYLVSDAADHVTGQTLRVNGGMVMP